MRLQIDIPNKIIVLLDPVTAGEIDGVMDEIKKLINEDLKQWKIQTALNDTGSHPSFPSNPLQYFPDFPYQPFVPTHPQAPPPNGDIIAPHTWCGDTSTSTSTDNIKTFN